MRASARNRRFEDRLVVVIPYPGFPLEYQSKLGKNEALRGPVANSFTSGELKFAFSIWKASDPQCCPTAGHVVGTYKVDLEQPKSTGRGKGAERQ